MRKATPLPELCTTDEALECGYQTFLLRALKQANELGLAGKRITRLTWHEDSKTGQQYLKFTCT